MIMPIGNETRRHLEKQIDPIPMRRIEYFRLCLEKRRQLDRLRELMESQKRPHDGRPAR